MSYQIVRMYQDPDKPSRVMLRGLTLEEVQAHCKNPETSSSTCTNRLGKKRTQMYGAWFDGYEETK